MEIENRFKREKKNFLDNFVADPKTEVIMINIFLCLLSVSRTPKQVIAGASTKDSSPLVKLTLEQVSII